MNINVYVKIFYDWPREPARRGQSFVLVGLASGQYRSVLPAHDNPLCPARKYFALIM